MHQTWEPGGDRAAEGARKRRSYLGSASVEFRLPEEHWLHLRTTNVVESPFAAVRLRTNAGKRFKRVENASALIWKLLTVAEKTFRRLNAPHLLAVVAAGAKYVNGKPVHASAERVAA